jgi:DNA polymerase-1
MEALGVGCDPSVLLQHQDRINQRLAAITSRAAALVGHSFNLSSSSQLAVVLYEELKLPPPTHAGGNYRVAARGGRAHVVCVEVV